MAKFREGQKISLRTAAAARLGVGIDVEVKAVCPTEYYGCEGHFVYLIETGTPITGYPGKECTVYVLEEQLTDI